LNKSSGGGGAVEVKARFEEIGHWEYVFEGHLLSWTFLVLCLLSFCHMENNLFLHTPPTATIFCLPMDPAIWSQVTRGH
jgi:hypothetical protein